MRVVMVRLPWGGSELKPVDSALFSLLFFFFVQISAGVAPMKWPQSRWLASVIFWISTCGALVCLGWYTVSQGWFETVTNMLGNRGAGIAILIAAICAGVFGLSLIASGEKHKSPIQDGPFNVDPNIYSESRAVKSASGRETDLYENTYYLIVVNTSDDGKTLRKVQVEYRGYDAPRPADIKDSTSAEVDIKHGNAAFFVIGRVISTKVNGMFKGNVTFDDETLRTFEHPSYAEHIGFHLSSNSDTNKYKFVLGSPPYPATGWVLPAVISAEDKKSRTVMLSIDARNELKPVSFAKDVKAE